MIFDYEQSYNDAWYIGPSSFFCTYILIYNKTMCNAGSWAFLQLSRTNKKELVKFTSSLCKHNNVVQAYPAHFTVK